METQGREKMPAKCSEIRWQSYRYELMPSTQQERKMRQFAGAARYVFNRALAIQKEECENTGRKLSGYAALCRMLTGWRRDSDTSWLGDCSVHVLQQSLRDLEGAWAKHFNSLGKLTRGEISLDRVVRQPRFKKRKKVKDSFRFPAPKKLHVEQHNSRVFLPKLGWVRYRNSRNIEGDLCNVTVSRDGNKWFISIQTQRALNSPIHPSTSIVGVDLGVVRFATLSNGEAIKPCNALKNRQARLKRYQCMMARRVELSKNWVKAKDRADSVRRKVKNIRKDFIHKATTMISKNHAVIVIEDLAVSNLVRSASRTKDNPGHNVKQKAALNRAILDQGWAETRRQLEYKAKWLGGSVIAVPPQRTSQTCPKCGYVSSHNRKTQAVFACGGCGYTDNADKVASINIERAGHARIACEVNGVVMPSAAGTRRMATASRHVGISREDAKIMHYCGSSSLDEVMNNCHGPAQPTDGGA
jgi:putative transposase